MFFRNCTRNPLNLIKAPILQTPLVNPLVLTMHLVCTLLILLGKRRGKKEVLILYTPARKYYIHDFCFRNFISLKKIISVQEMIFL